MDLRQYFRKIREVEAALKDNFPLLVSLETADGGKAGLITELPRFDAAKMIVDGRAVPASEEEKEFYREQQISAKNASEKAELARRVQIAIITDDGLKHQLSTMDDPCTAGK